MHVFSADWFGPNRWQIEQHTQGMGDEAYNILEIGSFEGRSACWMLKRFRHAHVTCVDTTLQPVFWPNIKASKGEDRVTMHLGPSRDILPKLPSNAYDLIYVDGGHGTIDVLEDAIHAFRRARVGAIIGFDDYLWSDPKYDQDGTPKPAIDAFLSIYSDKVSVLSKNYQVWLKKTAD